MKGIADMMLNRRTPYAEPECFGHIEPATEKIVLNEEEKLPYSGSFVSCSEKLDPAIAREVAHLLNDRMAETMVKMHCEFILHVLIGEAMSAQEKVDLLTRELQSFLDEGE